MPTTQPIYCEGYDHYMDFDGNMATALCPLPPTNRIHFWEPWNPIPPHEGYRDCQNFCQRHADEVRRTMANVAAAHRIPWNPGV